LRKAFQGICENNYETIKLTTLRGGIF